MSILRCTFILFFIYFSDLHLKAQPVRDSSFLYKKVEAFSKKRKITYILYKSFFRFSSPEPILTQRKKKSKKPKQPKVDSYSTLEGKIIRSINVVTYDPFGFDTKDTSVVPHEFLLRSGNALHVKTMSIRIRNILLIKKYDVFDSLKVKESERLVRDQSFVREAFVSSSIKNDSVDIYIRIYDVWSIIVTGTATPSTFTVNVKEKNILGMGYQFQNNFKQNYITGKNAFNSGFYNPNIYNTYISSSVYYSIDEYKNYYESVSFNRPFYSVFTAWAGGISLSQQLTREVVYDFDSTQFKQTFKSNTQDFWLGRSWPIFKGRSEAQRSTSLITNARYLRTHYVTRAEERFDTLHQHPNQEFYMLGIGISKRQYKLDKYIFRYGASEYVPYGRSYSLIGGYQIKDKVPRWYLGVRIYMAKYHDWGYFNIYVEYGTFLKKSQLEEGSFTSGIYYFSNIIKIGAWQFRQFIKPQLTIGHNRLKSDNLSLDNSSGIKGFNSIGLKGTQRINFTFQLQSYAPWRVLGFTLGPYVVCSFGMLGTEKSGFKRSSVYSSYGIGLLIKNEYLILNTFQISIAYYPVIPGEKNNVIKVNPLKTNDFGLRDFDISQPLQVSYQ